MKNFLLLLICAATLVGCNGVGKAQDGEPKAADFESDSACTTVADVAATEDTEEAKDEVDPTEAPLPATLADAPRPKGQINFMLPAGFLPNGGYRMFAVEGTEGKLTEEDRGSKVLYLLRLVLYEETAREEEPTGDGGRSLSTEGRLVVDAYNPTTKAFVARYEGSYSTVADFDAEGEFEHGGESYDGTRTDANGKKEDFSFFGD